MSEFVTCASFLLLPPCSSLPLCSVASGLAAVLSFGEDDVSAAAETFIVSVSTVSDILIAKSYWEMLANTENLKDRRTFVKASSGYVTGEEHGLMVIGHVITLRYISVK